MKGRQTDAKSAAKDTKVAKGEDEGKNPQEESEEEVFAREELLVEANPQESREGERAKITNGARL